MDVKVIRSEAAYRAMLAQVSELIDQDPSPETAEGERLELLSALVELWEAEQYPIDAPEPVRSSSTWIARA